MASGYVAGSFVHPNFEFYCSHASSDPPSEDVPSFSESTLSERLISLPAQKFLFCLSDIMTSLP